MFAYAAFHSINKLQNWCIHWCRFRRNLSVYSKAV